MKAFRSSPAALVLAFALAAAAPAQEAGPAPRLRAVADGHAGRLYRGVFTPDGKTFLAAGVGRVLRAWDTADGKERFALRGHAGSVHAVGLAGESLLASVGEDGTIFLWDLAARKKVAELPKQPCALHCLAVSHDGKLLATGGGDWKKPTPGEVRLWDLPGRREVAALAGPRRLVLALAFSPDDRLLAAADYSGDVRVWDVAGRKPVVTLSLGSPAGAVDFSPDGKYLVTGDYNGRLTLWDTADWLEEAAVRAHQGAVLFLRCGPRGDLVASAGWDGAVRLANLARLDERPPALVTRHKGQAWLVAWSPDGRTLASAGEDGRVHFWDVPAPREGPARPAPAAPAAAPVARTGPARVALLAPPGAPAAGAVRDLALVPLGAEKGVVLLDRSEVERLQREQGLSLAGLTSADTAVRAGKILAADLIGVVEALPGDKEGLGFTAFDAATGVRLADAGFTRPDPEAQARDVAGAVRTALRKWRAGPGGLKTVCFLPARNADLPRDRDAFCEGLAASLERQLLNDPGVVTLERKRLDAVTREKALAASAAGRRLLASLLIVETEVGRAPGGGVRATLTVRDSAGKLVRKVTHDSADAEGAGLLGPLAAGLHEALHGAAGPGLVRRGREARRFLHEAEVLWKHALYRPALQAAEAAFALRPAEESRQRLARYLNLYALEIWRPGAVAATRWTFAPFDLSPERAREGLNLARRGRQLLDAAPRPEEAPDNGGFWGLGESADNLHAENRFTTELRYARLRPPDPDLNKELAAFQADAVRRHVARVRDLARRVGPGAAGAERLTDALTRYIDYLQDAAPDSTTLARAVRDVLDVWLKATGGLPPDPGLADRAHLFGYRVLGAACDTGRPDLHYTADDRELLLPALRAAAEHPQPALRLYGAFYETRELLKLGRIDDAGAGRRVRRAEEEARRLIERPPAGSPARHRVALYVFLDHLARAEWHARGRQGGMEDTFALADYMLAHRDVEGGTWCSLAGRAWVQPENRARGLHLIRRMLEVYDSPPHRLFHDPGGRAKKELQYYLWQLLKVSPGLDRKQVAPPWAQVLPLADLAAVPHANALLAPTRDGDHVYLLAGGTDPARKQPFLRLVRASLAGGPPQLLGKALVTLKDFNSKEPGYAFRNLPRFVTECVLDNGRLYAGTVDDGIYAFPLDGGDAVRLGAKEGLPSPGVVSLTAVEGRLVAALEGGYLVVLEPGAGRCEVVVSSRRTQQASPFDNAGKLSLRDLRADPERHRVLFIAYQEREDHPNTGTWEYDLAARRFRKLLPLALYRPSAVRDGRLYLRRADWQGAHWLGRLDLAEDRFTLLEGRIPGAAPRPAAGLPRDLSAAFPGALYHAGYLWLASPFSRRPLGGGPEEFLPHPARGTALNVTMDQCLEPAGPAALLAGDWRGLSLVRLKDAAPAAAPRPGPKPAPQAGPLRLRAVGTGHANRVYRGAFSADGKTFFSAGGDRVIRAWDTANGKERFALRGHAAPLQGLAVAGANLLVSAGEDGTIFLWDLAARKKVAELPRHKRPIHCLAVSADGKLLATGGGVWNGPQPGELRLWDLGKRKLLAELAGHRRIVLGLAFSPDGKRLAALDQSGDLKLWDVAARKPAAEGHDAAGLSLRFAPDGKALAVGGFDGRLRLLAAAGLAEEAQAAAHRGTVLSVDFAPGGGVLASAGWDGAVRLWNPRALEDVPPLTVAAHEGQAWLVAFSPDGRTLATAGEKGRVKFWDVPAGLAKRLQPPPRAPRVAARPRTGEPKVAVVAASEAAAARGLEELALARLGGDKGLRLLERAGVERLLREQKLSLSGLVEANTAVRAGKILAVDLLAVLSSAPGSKENGGVVVFDAATGVRLADAGFAEAGLAAQADQVAAEVRTAAARWRAGPGGLKTVCLLPVRNADLPRAMDGFCEGLSAALARELLGGDIAVLERQRLDLINQEKGLAAAAATRELLASLTTLEMDVSRGTKGAGIRAVVTLRDSAGRLLRRVTQEVADPNGAGLVAALAGKVRAALKAAPADAAASRNRESRRFLRDARLLWEHKSYLQGLRAAEAAFALKPGGEQRGLLAEYLVRYATELLWPGHMRSLVYGTWNVPVAPDRLREALVYARRGLRLMDEARAAPAGGPDGLPFQQSFLLHDAERFFFNHLPYLRVVPDDAGARDEFEAFRLECLRRTAAACYAAAEAGGAAPQVLQRYTGAAQAAQEFVGWLAPSPAAYTQTECDLARKWLELSRRCKPGEIPVDTAVAFGQSLDRVYTQHLQPTSPGPAQADAALEVFAAAAKHPNPLVRLYGRHFQMRLEEKAGRISREEALARHRALLAEGKRLIDGPPLGPAEKYRVALYHLLDYAIGHLYLHKTGAAVIGEYFDLCDFMLAHGDVVEDVVRDAVGYGSPVRELNVKALQIIDRALRLTDSPARRYFADSPERFKLHMKEARQKVLTKLPDRLKGQVPWESARSVVQSSDLKATLLLPGLVHGDYYYFFAGGYEPAKGVPLLRLVRVPLAGGPPQVVGKAPVSANKPPPAGHQFAFFWGPAPLVASSAVLDGWLYAGTRTDGILAFPLGGGEPKRVGEKEGLPVPHVQKLAAAAGVVVAALEGGYLVLYDPASGRVETLASSRRGEKLSPFDDAGPFTVAEMAADPARQRVLFTLSLPRADDPRGGLWELDVRTRRFRRVQPYVSGAWSVVRDGRIYLHQSDLFHDRPDALLAYDLAADRFLLLHGEAPAGYGEVKRAGLPADLSVPFPGRGLLRRGWFWRVYPFSRRRLDGKAEQYFPSPRDNTWTYPFSASAALREAGPGRLLVGDYGGLYLLDLKQP